MEPQQQRQLGNLLTLLEATYPAEDLFNRLGQDEVRTKSAPDFTWLLDQAIEIWSEWQHDQPDPEHFIRSLVTTEPFDQAPNPEALLREATQS